MQCLNAAIIHCEIYSGKEGGVGLRDSSTKSQTMDGVTYFFGGQQLVVPCILHPSWDMKKLANTVRKNLLSLTKNREKEQKINSKLDIIKSKIALKQDEDISKVVFIKCSSENHSDSSLCNYCGNPGSISHQDHRYPIQIQVGISRA